MGSAARRRPTSRRPDKVFGPGTWVPLDRNAKARILAYAEARTAALRMPGQHRGPLTRAYLDVLRALLWGFHNARSGCCFPSYERIAEAAKVCRSTVAAAIQALRDLGVLSWENRLVWQRVTRPGLLGPEPVRLPRRTSNAYQLLDPQLRARPVLPKSKNPTVTIFKDSQSARCPEL